MSPVSAVDEAELRELIARGELDRATERAIRTYGPELVGWLCSMIDGEADAYDAFSWLCEQLWRSLKRYDGRCSIRTWCYMLARHATSRARSAPGKHREILVSEIPSIVHAFDDVWNTTKVGARRAESVYAQLRRELDDEDQTLLVLRVDRGLNWVEIAIVLLGETAEPDAVKKKAASLRKQFERLKEKLKGLAAERLAD
ncbi:MAG TPA: sigma factor [Kofleriaceae bacterium]|jgi:RNA polymerase sigma-70 factor (ECF subfamily)